MGTALDKYADMEPNWDHPVVIESHINGVRSMEMNPNTPTSYDEIAEDAIRCWEAGAGVSFALSEGLRLTPGVRYRVLSRDLEIDDVTIEVDLEYLAAEVGASWSF